MNPIVLSQCKHNGCENLSTVLGGKSYSCCIIHLEKNNHQYADEIGNHISEEGSLRFSVLDGRTPLDNDGRQHFTSLPFNLPEGADFRGSLFVAIDKQTDQACDVVLNPPSGLRYQQWRVATSLQPAGARLREFGCYRAQNYDDLIDHPVEMGEFDVETFEVNGVPHDLVVSGTHRADLERVRRDLAVICAHHVDLFGELPKMQRYVFLVMCVGHGYGGLEHRSSTSLICSRDDLPLKHIAEVTDEYRAFLGLCSHEYFHTWNVKRIKPQVFTPYDLSQESHTRLLWVFEGITSYYDDLTLARTGLISIDRKSTRLNSSHTDISRMPSSA